MIANVLGRKKATEWIVRQSIVFDWFNGPKQGICALTTPLSEFEFKCIAEKHNPDGIDHRLYAVNELPIGSVDWVLGVIKQLGSPENKVWLPVWSFGSKDDNQRANSQIDQLLMKAEPSKLVVYSQDMVSILGCWAVEALPENPEDLFDLFGIGH